MEFFITGGPPNNSGLNSSQNVRQGLRVVVAGRSQQTANAAGNANNNPNNPLRRNLTSPLDPLGATVGLIVDNSPNSMNQPQQQQQQQLSDLDPSMRFNFDMPQGELGLDQRD